MAITAKGICRIDHVNAEGLGIAQVNQSNKIQHFKNNRINSLKVPFTMVNELVEFEHHQYRRQSNTILKNIVEPSKERVNAPCKYFGACGGCLLQHMSKESYQKFKLGLVQSSLQQFSLATIAGIELITIASGQRRRANFRACFSFR